MIWNILQLMAVLRDAASWLHLCLVALVTIAGLQDNADLHFFLPLCIIHSFDCFLYATSKCNPRKLAAATL